MSISANRPALIAIVGPTASGKTALSIEIARRFEGEIVSADSRQIYRGMDIGTAKPTREEMSVVPHHLIDIKNPDEDYTVAEYKRDAIAAIRNIQKRNKLPVLIGGTGLYIKAVVENLDIPEVKADPVLRQKIEDEIEKDGLAKVFEKLVTLDPEAAYIIDPKNPRRVVRALEVALVTGKPFTAARRKGEPLFNALVLGLDPPPEVLRERIGARIDQMMRDGLLKEVKQLVERYGADCQAFDAIGYREIIAHLQGKVSLEEAVAQMKLNTWHYAKRQLTWFRKNKDVKWCKGVDEAVALAKAFLGR